MAEAGVQAACLERQREKHIAAVKKLDRQIAKLSGDNGSVAAPAAKPARKRRSWKLSAETRRKMSEAAKRRYAKSKVTAPAAAEPKPKAKRRAFSAETRQKMAESQRRRWAKVKPVPEPAKASS